MSETTTQYGEIDAVTVLDTDRIRVEVDRPYSLVSKEYRTSSNGRVVNIVRDGVLFQQVGRPYPILVSADDFEFVAN